MHLFALFFVYFLLVHITKVQPYFFLHKWLYEWGIRAARLTDWTHHLLVQLWED